MAACLRAQRTFTRGKYPERAGPGPNDPSSVFWLYHSHADELQDIASGLFGGIVITRRGMALPDGRPKDVDHEFVSMFIAINENESWYLDDNIHAHATDPKGVNRAQSLAYYSRRNGRNDRGDRLSWTPTSSGRSTATSTETCR